MTLEENARKLIEDAWHKADVEFAIWRDSVAGSPTNHGAAKALGAWIDVIEQLTRLTRDRIMARLQERRERVPA
jgi:hypothetical protein